MKIAFIFYSELILSIYAAPEFFRNNNKQRQQQEICETTGDEIPSKSSSCWKYSTGDDQSQQGCDNQACEAAVCECDMYCCSTSWDLNCRGHLDPDPDKIWDNYFTPGCSASILCCEDTDFNSIQGEKKEINVVACQSGGDTTMGYVDIQSLRQDMSTDYAKSISDPKDKYEYILCPDTVFDLKGMTASNSTTFLLSNTEIKCGVDGSSSNNCLFHGGDHHMVFHPDLAVSDVLIEGIKFTRSESTSILAWGQSSSSATFRDCHWEDNYGHTLIDIYPSDKNNRRLSSSPIRSLRKIEKYGPRHSFNHLFHDETNNIRDEVSSIEEAVDVILATDQVSVHSSHRTLQDDVLPGDGMVLRIYDCLLSSNNLSTGLILNVAGVVDITKSSFALNTNQAVGVGVSDAGTLILDTDSDFVKNVNGFSTIFLDPTSKLRIMNKHANSDDKKIGLATSENEGLRCSGIFVENKDSECLSTGGFDGACYGICCDFKLQCFNA